MKLTKQDEAELEEATQVAAKILLLAMKEFNIPNFIKGKVVVGDDTYELNFKKLVK